MLALRDGNKNASRYLLLANTPLYIVRNLRNDNDVINLASSKSSSELFSCYAKSASKAPANIYEEVDPYIYAVAMLIKRDRAHINDMKSIESENNYKWMRYILEYIDSAITPSKSITVEFPNISKFVRQTVMSGDNR